MEKWTINIPQFIVGASSSILGYFSPIQGVLNVMVGVILVDMVIGIIASRKRGMGITSVKLWRTVTKIFFSVLVIGMLYAIDQEMEVFEMHRLVAFLIAGFEIWSILENIGFITDHPVFLAIQKLMRDKVEDVTGVDLEPPSTPMTPSAGSGTGSGTGSGSGSETEIENTPPPSTSSGDSPQGEIEWS